MKSSFFGKALTLLCLSFCLSYSHQAQAQLRTPDLVVTGCKVSRTNTNELNVIWSITNKGTAEAQLLGLNKESLVSYTLEGSKKKEASGVQHTWSKIEDVRQLELTQKLLKPGETITGTFRAPYIEQENLVSYRLSIECNSAATDSKKENNGIIAILIGL